MNYPVISRDPAIQQEYERMRRDGQSHNCAEMFATQTSPGLQTDTRFLHGRHGNGFYSSQLQSWVESRADVKRIAAKKGLSVEGSGCNYTAVHENPSFTETPYRVADDLVEDYVLDILDDHPTALMDDPELPAKVRTRLEGTE